MAADRQKIFTNMVTILHGKGQGRIKFGNKVLCSYFPPDHPGCGIGCQPGFREKFEIDLHLAEQAIDELMDYNPAVAVFFGVDLDSPDGHDEESDYGFLKDVQSFHDANDNWTKRKKWRRKSLATFAETWKLKVPEIPA